MIPRSRIPELNEDGITILPPMILYANGQELGLQYLLADFLDGEEGDTARDDEMRLFFSWQLLNSWLVPCGMSHTRGTIVIKDRKAGPRNGPGWTITRSWQALVEPGQVNHFQRDYLIGLSPTLEPDRP